MLCDCSLWILVTHKWLKQLELTWVISAHHMCQQNQMHFLSAIGPALRCRQMVLAPTRSKGHSHRYKAHECGSRMGWILLDASKVGVGPCWVLWRNAKRGNNVDRTSWSSHCSCAQSGTQWRWTAVVTAIANANWGPETVLTPFSTHTGSRNH